MTKVKPGSWSTEMETLWKQNAPDVDDEATKSLCLAYYPTMNQPQANNQWCYYNWQAKQASNNKEFKREGPQSKTHSSGCQRESVDFDLGLGS